MRKYQLILIDTLILCVVSSVLAIGVNYTVALLKGDGKKDDPIVTAIIQSDAKEVEKLVQKGESVTNETDELGRTALMSAAFVNFASPKPLGPKEQALVDALSRCGIEPGNSTKPEYKQLAAALTGLGIQLGNILSDTDAKRTALIELLLTHGAKPDTRDNDGWTALMWASWSGLKEVVTKLLESGASPEFADKQGNTALIIAAQRGHATIVAALLAKGADATAANKAGLTPLAAAKTGLAQFPDQSVGFAAVIARLSPANAPEGEPIAD